MAYYSGHFSGIGSFGAIVGGVLPFALLVGALPQLSCSQSVCIPGSVTEAGMHGNRRFAVWSKPRLAPGWRPWVDDARGSRAVRADELLCSDERSTGVAPLLVEAPLPPGYDPVRAPAGKFACVRVTRDGRAVAAWLAGDRPASAMGDALIAEILSSWRFEQMPGAQPQWVRVRIEDPARNLWYR